VCVHDIFLSVPYSPDLERISVGMAVKAKKEEGSSAPAREAQAGSDSSNPIGAPATAKSVEPKNAGLRNVLVFIFVAVLAVVIGQVYNPRSVTRHSHKGRRRRAPEDDGNKIPNVNDKTATGGTSWAVDPDWAEATLSSQSQCQFPLYVSNAQGTGSSIVNSEGKEVSVNEFLLAPAVLRGFMDSWPAMRNNSWSRSKLLNTYGKKAVALEASAIVAYSDRRGNVKFHSLQKALATLRTPGADDLVVNDNNVLTSADMREDFEVPAPFQHWHTQSNKGEEKELEQQAWHVLNIGASKSGLPFHSRGRSYLGLVHGLKRWFVYPPGHSPPSSVARVSNPLQSVFEWFTNVYPLFDSLDAKVPSVSARTPLTERGAGYRPLECVQQPGDIVYIPAGWAQQTLNVGETVAVGGQQAFGSAERYKFFTKVLKKAPNNFDALQNAGTAAAYLAMEEENRVKYNITASTAAGMVRINPQSRSKDLENLVIGGEDTWYVQYFLQNDDRSRGQAMIWNRVAGALRGLVSVGSIEVPDKRIFPEEHASVVERHNLAEFVDEEGKFTQQILRLYLGNRHAVGATTEKAIIKNALTVDLSTFKQEKSGMGIGLTADPQQLADYAVNILADASLKLGVGSCTDIGAKAKRLYKQSANLLEQSMVLEPLHPGVRSILPDILGHAGLQDSMLETLRESVKQFDPLASISLAVEFNKNLPARPSKTDPDAPKTVPASILAPIYHLLAEVCLNHDNAKEALPLLQKCLSLQPDYGPALIDTAAAHITLKDRTKAEEAIEEAIVSGKMLKTHPKLRQLKEYMDKQDDIQERRQQGDSVRDQSSMTKLRRHGQPPIPPKAMRTQEGESAPSVNKAKPTGKAPQGQRRGMSRDQAQGEAQRMMGAMDKDQFLEDVKLRIKEGKLGA